MPWWDVIGGILMTLVLSKIYAVELTFWVIALAVGFSLLPDIDFLIWLAKHHWKIDKWAHEHRDIAHYPIFYLPAGYFPHQFLVSDFHANLFLLCSLLHFLHDSVGIGWGMKWLFPLSKRNYKFFTRKHLGEQRRFLVSWTPAELKDEVEKRGEDDWFKNKKYYKYT